MYLPSPSIYLASAVVMTVVVVCYLNRPCCTVPQGTDGVALDLLADLPDHVDLRFLSIAAHKTPHHSVHPVHSYERGGGRSLSNFTLLVAFITLVI